MIMAKKDSECDVCSGGRSETIAAIAVGIMCLLFGVPLWWKTTTTYRAALPYSDIEQIFQQETTCRIPVTLVSCSQEPENGSPVKQLERFLQSGQDGRSSLSMQYSMYFRNCLTAEKRLMEESSSIAEFDGKLSRLRQNPVGEITVYIFDHSSVFFPDVKIDVHVGQHRAIYVKGPKLEASLESAAALIRTVIVPEASLDKHYKTARGVVHTVADLESMRSFRYTPGYELSFTLLIPEPHNIQAHWNLDHAQKVYLDPLTRKLEEFAEFTVASQVLYYTSLSVKPKKKDSSFYFSHSSLPHIITPVEAKLGSHATNFPNLNFVVYIPPLDQSPLYIHSSNGKPVSTNAFLSPRWGGVLIHNTPIPDENATRPVWVEVKNSAVMPVFLAQLRLLLGIPSPDDIESVLLEKPKEHSVLDWEYDSLLRRHCVENLASASASLFSLSQLLEKISNIVINDDIAKQVYTAVESIQSSHRFLAEGKLHPAFHASKRALIASEKAFFDPSLLQLLYFPDDQKFAIYIPLFLPVSIPVVLSLIKAFKWIKQQRRKSKVD
eukprot:XP_781371.3 PREDICTED: GPI transamidase component PIG-S-like isoform X2 [Strongylocentrotus purpuratus]